ncbi:hypothetical protein PV08_09105 [Exophiala spinifera]|uniref:Transcription factor domain-containing protein n=1 Tax=Exophiala spinifera TaxID=91928 RepID=A0A0D1ZFQ9_9EURO|nr:uncharacterized protein PV08_09105 [Exophiala spinifera]KIW11832.1 hypothetical protein PV08_09105 [Exophiala spinifera]
MSHPVPTPDPSQYDTFRGDVCSHEWSPVSWLSQNRSDPFATDTADSPQVSELLDHAVQHFWSHLSPSHHFGSYNPVNALYLAHMQSSQMAYHSYILVISTNLDYLRMSSLRQNVFQSMRLRCIHAATTLVRELIDSMPPQPTRGDVPDELIGSILSLSCCHALPMKSANHPVSRFSSPLATAQCLDMWSATPFLESHRRAVVQLVKLKGGLEALDSIYLAAVVQLNDLIDASRKTRKPTWPWQNTVIASCSSSAVRPFVATALLTYDNDLATAFFPLTKYLPCGHELERAILAVAEATAMLKIYKHNITSRMAEMVQLRNRAQYFVLDLDPLPLLVGPDEKDKEYGRGRQCAAVHVPSFLYEVIRISLLIYNNLVLYPMSPATGVETRLATRLKFILCSGLQAQLWNVPQYTDLLLWSMMLGGISTEDIEDGKWFQTQYFELARDRNRLRSWFSTVESLSTFIWLDFVLNEEAEKFWATLPT